MFFYRKLLVVASEAWWMKTLSPWLKLSVVKTNSFKLQVKVFTTWAAIKFSFVYYSNKIYSVGTFPRDCYHPIGFW